MKIAAELISPLFTKLQWHVSEARVGAGSHHEQTDEPTARSNSDIVPNLAIFCCVRKSTKFGRP
jgi:hypothetical protein